MQEIREYGIARFRCHTGHGFTLEGLRAQRQRQAMVSRRLTEEARRRGEERAAAGYERRAWDCDEGAATIRRPPSRGSGGGEDASPATGR